MKIRAKIKSMEDIYEIRSSTQGVLSFEKLKDNKEIQDGEERMIDFEHEIDPQ